MWESSGEGVRGAGAVGGGDKRGGKDCKAGRGEDVLGTELAADAVRADCTLSILPSDHTPPAETCTSGQTWFQIV